MNPHLRGARLSYGFFTFLLVLSLLGLLLTPFTHDGQRYTLDQPREQCPLRLDRWTGYVVDCEMR